MKPEKEEGAQMPTTANRWCILRTAGPRTLAVARSLAAAGFDAWTPAQIAQRRRPRSSMKLEIEAPIMPTFVFVRADRLSDLRRVLALPLNPHPAFSIFQHAGEAPLVRDSELTQLREAEERAAVATEARRRGEQAQDSRKAKDAQRRKVAVGTTVSIPHGAFAGMTGIVDAGDRKNAWVNLGGGFRLKIDTWLFAADHIENVEP